MSNIIAFASPSAPLAAATVDQRLDYTGKEQELFTLSKHELDGPFGPCGKYGIFVDNNSQAINTVSDSYEIHQPNDILGQFVKATDGQLSINRVLSNPKNGGLMISAKYDNVQIAEENHDINVVFYTSHCGKYKTFLTLDVLRIACFNQLPALYRNNDRFIFAEKHYKNALDVELIGGMLSHIPESIIAHNERMMTLKEKYLTANQFVELFVDHYKLKKEQKQFDSKVAKARAIYANATGQHHLSDSAYKALNAVTFMNTHEGRNTAMKEENALIKGGNDSLAFIERLLAA